MRIVVVLPAPLGPSRPKTEPWRIRRSTPSRARVFSKVLTRPWVAIASGIGVPLVWCAGRVKLCAKSAWIRSRVAASILPSSDEQGCLGLPRECPVERALGVSLGRSAVVDRPDVARAHADAGAGRVLELEPENRRGRHQGFLSHACHISPDVRKAAHATDYGIVELRLLFSTLHHAPHHICYQNETPHPSACTGGAESFRETNRLTSPGRTSRCARFLQRGPRHLRTSAYASKAPVKVPTALPRATTVMLAPRARKSENLTYSSGPTGLVSGRSLPMSMWSPWPSTSKQVGCSKPSSVPSV